MPLFPVRPFVNIQPLPAVMPIMGYSPYATMQSSFVGFRATLKFCKRRNRSSLILSGDVRKWQLKSLMNLCSTCEDKRICQIHNYRNLETRDTFTIHKTLKHQVCLFQEEGIGTEFRVGRFTFKTTKDNK
jgi:hypothetical protein